MSKDGPIEIGWKKELLEDVREDSKDQDRSRSPKRKKENYRRLSDSSTSSSSSSSKRSSSETSSLAGDADEQKRKKREKREKRKAEKKLKKEQKKLEKAQRKELKKAKKEKRKEEKKLKKLAKKSKVKNDSESEDCGVPIDLMFNKARAPETKEEYEKRQSQIRKVEDPETGRTRLIKGDGEILEEIVSRDRHREINKQATQGDGKFFQAKTVGWKIG